ncbi:unnamed protein product [Tilletia controversa]|nr:unnamed protein product [Tilletia controversa]CAD6948815.1 unnamed protein product [Tilletia controversa]CAD6968518.1 unnamed protein product [Tilletia controversa]
MKFTTSLSSAAVLATSALVLVLAPSPVFAARRGAPWGADTRWASRLLKGKIDWYHHWQDGPFSAPSGVEYVPTFWGASKWDKWNLRKAEMNRNLPGSLLAFNEPDIKSQGNMASSYAADVYAKEICPWQKRGVRISTPQIVWDYEGWMDPFLRALRAKGSAGCEPDFLAIHWYGGKNDIEKFKSFIQKGWSKYKKPIWITEVGLASSSNPTTAESESFLRRALSWVDSQSYVKRITWTGVFAISNPPDSFISNRVAMFQNNGDLRNTAFIMQYE